MSEEYRCPECGSFNLGVSVELSATLNQNEFNHYITTDPKDEPFCDDNSVMWCNEAECQYMEDSRCFKVRLENITND